MSTLCTYSAIYSTKQPQFHVSTNARKTVIDIIIGDLEWEGSEADNEISDVTNEIPSNVFMIEDHEWGNLENIMAVVSTSGAPSADVNTNLSTYMYEDLALPSTSAQSTSGVLALPPPATSTSTAMDTSEPAMTVAIPTDMSVEIAQTCKREHNTTLFLSIVCFFSVVNF